VRHPVLGNPNPRAAQAVKRAAHCGTWVKTSLPCRIPLLLAPATCSIEKAGESLWVFSIIPVPEVSQRCFELAQGGLGSYDGSPSRGPRG